MIKVGFIGNESSSLADRFLHSGRISPSEIIVTTNSENSMETVKDSRNRFNTANCNSDVVKAAKYVFLCTKPSETESVLKEIRDCISPETNIISTDFPAGIHFMESFVSCKVTKLAPTMLSENGRRVSVISHGSKVEENEAEYIEALLCEVCNAKVYKAKRF